MSDSALSQGATPPEPAPTQPAESAPLPAAASAPQFSWKNHLAKEYMDEGAVKVFQDSPEGLNNAMKSLLHSQKMIGADKIPVPGKNATPEQWSEVYKKLGLPESVDKYEVPVPQNLKVDEKFFGGFKQTAHKAGILPTQAKALFDWYEGQRAELDKTAKDQYKGQIQEQRQALQQELGPTYQKTINQAFAAAKEFGGDEFINELNQLGLGDNGLVIKTLAKIGAAMGEDKVKSALGARMGKTSDEIDQEIRNIEGSPELYDPTHINHKNAVTERDRLYRARYPAA